MLSTRRSAATVTLAALAAASLLAVAGCSGSGAGVRRSHVSEEGPLSTVVNGKAGRSAPIPANAAPATTPAPAGLPGVGPKTAAEVPADATQAVLVTGAGPDANTSSVTLYVRTDADASWTAAGSAWPAHNALRGWTAQHHTGDLRSPVGVFDLTDAGGRLPDPGTRLSYDHAPIGFTVHGTGFHGESLRGAFDYVIAINYNRKPGTSPRDWTRPLGESRGGGIWLHVDHGGPTQGCVSLPPAVMKTLLRTLTPAHHPVVVMGDAKSLAR
jgi:L,D-peptidoglycan transpeptidase YkuD (ErfK/YbiS/YcfS/YnhG family)